MEVTKKNLSSLLQPPKDLEQLQLSQLQHRPPLHRLLPPPDQQPGPNLAPFPRRSRQRTFSTAPSRLLTHLAPLQPLTATREKIGPRLLKVKGLPVQARDRKFPRQARQQRSSTSDPKGKGEIIPPAKDVPHLLDPADCVSAILRILTREPDRIPSVEPFLTAGAAVEMLGLLKDDAVALYELAVALHMHASRTGDLGTICSVLSSLELNIDIKAARVDSDLETLLHFCRAFSLSTLNAVASTPEVRPKLMIADRTSVVIVTRQDGLFGIMAYKVYRFPYRRI
ncbi:hypothetical protein A4X13_0g6279 [Tilletia indica]|uniref:Uncharacterized protein n=1 Tax=Tilletia indica TaxID=43049 RepID=A0A177TBD5_9BASI|nr:hypothetical protein A4X13_0g6279 [Tilletia indica]